MMDSERPLSPFDANAVRNAVGDRIPELTLRWVEQTGSTNADLAKLAESGTGEWTVLVADCQTSGRGRHARGWASPEGGLYVSILLKPPETDSPITLIPLTIGLALHTALLRLAKAKSINLKLHLKWPNDVMVSEGKLAGILCESSLVKEGWRVIAGVGVNISPLPDLVKNRLDKAVTSLIEESRGIPWNREEILSTFLLELASRMNQWERDPDGLRKDWMRAADLKGRGITVKTASGPVSGVARGISDAGALQLTTTDGDLEIHATEGIEENS
jgi:BirA family biotin operon repressor/biotin-[acetyl-CoA-carboxylase] ligase